jgi:hypothetical protein
MRMWIDTEFNGFGGQLLSIAIVAEDGSEFYEILEFRESIDPWVLEHVIPVMNSHSTNGLISSSRDPKPLPYVRGRLAWFLTAYSSVHLIADWPEDIAHFCCLLLTDTPGERISTPPLTMEIVRVDTVSKVPHNALEDARAMCLAGI